VKWLSNMAFSIGDTSGFGDYKSGGIVEQVKVPKEHSFLDLTKMLMNPYANGKIADPIDFAKFGRPELLYASFTALLKYYSAHQCLPELNCERGMNEVLSYAKEIFTVAKEQKLDWTQNCQEFDDEVVKNVARWSRAQVSPVCAFLGGVVAQEVVKFTGKYMPINQWLWFDFFETVDKLENPTRTPMNTKYDDQIAIYGRELQEKLANLNLFMIGAGALGCEFLKDFSLMGISSKNGLVTVTDNDNIEVSNLNRQFLFRRDDVHTPKSKTAARVIMEMNKDFKCRDLQRLVCDDSEHIFDDDFWTKQDFIINAVDNVKARRYIDRKCTWYGKNLIDSGTLGTKAHVQTITPNITSCYNDTQDPVEETIPMCTLHNFPAMIEHCIEWGRDRFTGYFTGSIQDTLSMLTDPNAFYINLKKEGNSTFQLQKVKLDY